MARLADAPDLVALLAAGLNVVVGLLFMAAVLAIGFGYPVRHPPTGN